MSLYPICIPIIATESSEMYPKIILNKDIGIWNFIFLFIWQKNLHLILLLIGNNLIYVKLLFLSSILLDKLIYNSFSCRGMIYDLHFRRCISDVHVHFIWQVDPVVDFIWEVGISESEHMNSYLIFVFTLSEKRGVYLNLYTSSENMNSYLMSMFTSSKKEGAISESVHFIWK